MGTFSEFGSAIGDIGLRRQARKKEDESKATMARFADAMAQKYGPEVGEAVKAGQLDDYTKLLKEQETIKDNQRKNSGARYQKDPKDSFDMIRAAQEKATKIMQDQYGKVEEARKSGDRDAFKQQMEVANQLQDALKEKLLDMTASMDKDMKATRVELVANQINAAFSGMESDSVNLISDTLVGQLPTRFKMSKDVVDDMESYVNPSGVNINLSGIPGYNDLQKYSWSLYANKKASKAQIMGVLNADDQTLLDTANDKEAPIEFRRFAGAVYKTSIAGEKYIPGLKIDVAADIEMGIEKPKWQGARGRIDAAKQEPVRKRQRRF